MKRIGFLMFVLLTCLISGCGNGTTTNVAAPQITTFDAPGAGTGAGQGTLPEQNNQSGMIVGIYIDANGVAHGFVRDVEGNSATFDAPGAGTVSGEGTSALGINDAGTVVGNYGDNLGTDHGFLRTSDGTITTFDAPGAGGPCGTGCHQGTRPAAINLAGEISGYIIDASGGGHGFLRAPDGTYTFFDPSGSVFTDADTVGIDPAGAITGPYFDANGALHGYVRDPDGTLTNFDAPGAGTGPAQGTIPNTIGPTGTIPGTIIDASGVFHGFLRAPDGTFTMFDVLGAGSSHTTQPPSSSRPRPFFRIPGQGTQAVATNQAGITEGNFIDASFVAHGFIRTPDGTITTFDPPGAGTGAGQGTIGPSSINVSGAVTGFYVDASGVYHGFVRTP